MLTLSGKDDPSLCLLLDLYYQLVGPSFGGGSKMKEERSMTRFLYELHSTVLIAHHIGHIIDNRSVLQTFGF